MWSKRDRRSLCGDRSGASASGYRSWSRGRCSSERPLGCSFGPRRTAFVVRTRSLSWMEAVASDSTRRERSWHVASLQHWPSPPAASWTPTMQTVSAPSRNRSRSCVSHPRRTAPAVRPERWRRLPVRTDGTRLCSSLRPTTSHEPGCSSSDAMRDTWMSSPPARPGGRCTGLRPWGMSGQQWSKRHCAEAAEQPALTRSPSCLGPRSRQRATRQRAVGGLQHVADLARRSVI
jgi:hypothetical protein